MSDQNDVYSKIEEQPKKTQKMHDLLKSMDEKIEKSKQPDVKTEEETKEEVEKAFEKKALAVL